MAQVQWAYVWGNLISSMATITPSTEDATYTRASLYDRRINKPFRFTSKASQSLLFDLLSAYTADVVVALKHNFTSAAVLTLQGGITSSVLQFSTTLAWNATNIYKYFVAPSGYRYWKLSVDDPTNPRNPEMGELYLSNIAQFARGYQWGSEEGGVFNVDEHRTEFGTIIAYPKYTVRTRRLSISPMTAVQKQEIHDLFFTVSGSLFPFCLIPDMSAPEILFGRLRNAYAAAASPETYWTSAIEFLEESPGKAVA